MTHRGHAAPHLHGHAHALPAGMQVIERGWLSCNSVLFHDDAHTATLVDSGYCTQAVQTQALVQRALDGRRLARIVNTHLHSDHCGGNALLQQGTGAQVLIPPGQARAVADWDEAALSYRATAQECPRFRPDGVLLPGSTLETGGGRWQVLTAPGHDPHSLMLWNAAERVLISADALWQHGFGAIFPEVEGESGFAEQRALLALIEQLHPRLVIPGHGAPFVDVPDALARAHARLAALAIDPRRNARQVAKVLIKFWLLEVRTAGVDALIAHFAPAHYFQVIHQRWFDGSFESFMRQLVDDLARGGALALDGETISNLDRGNAEALVPQHAVRRIDP